MKERRKKQSNDELNKTQHRTEMMFFSFRLLVSRRKRKMNVELNRNCFKYQNEKEKKRSRERRKNATKK